MVSLTDTELNEAMEAIGLVREDFIVVKQARDLVEAREVLRVLKAKAHRGFRLAAKQLHPDINGGDERMTQLFIRAKAVVDHIEKIQLREPVPMCRFVQSRIRVVYGPGFASSTAGTTSTTTPWRGSSTYQVWTHR